uniref:Uncharacterized protein n=1 Tax=Lutzomyia longipalpis TaxID=7200 RepID=A0A1B0CVD9_LUTLO
MTAWRQLYLPEFFLVQILDLLVTFHQVLHLIQHHLDMIRTYKSELQVQEYHQRFTREGYQIIQTGFIIWEMIVAAPSRAAPPTSM